MNYDPLTPPNPKEWLSLDEHEQLRLVQDYHKRARIKLPNAKVHAVAHTIVENQVALGDEIPVRRTLLRLMSVGLDRHEAVHAVGSVLIFEISNLLKRDDLPADADLAQPYYAALDRLTAAEWLQSFEED